MAPNFTPRRSGRIAKADRGLDSEMKAKRVLLRRLGLLQQDEPISDSILKRYARMFDHPLAADTIAALADYHDWVVPANPFDALHAPPVLTTEA